MPLALRRWKWTVGLVGSLAGGLAGCASHDGAASTSGGTSGGTGGASSSTTTTSTSATTATTGTGGAGGAASSTTTTTSSSSSSSTTSSGAPVSVCGAPSGTLAWTASIAGSAAGLTLVDVQAGPTDDVVVADLAGPTTFEQHRWSAAGAVVSVHQDPGGAYTGPTLTSGLFIDPGNDAFYGVLLNGLVSGDYQTKLMWNKVSPAGAVVFSETNTSNLPTSYGAPQVSIFQVGGDSGGNLHGSLLMQGAEYYLPGVYCYSGTGTNLGIPAANVAGALAANDFLWPSQDGGLVLWRPLTDTTSLGCSASLTVPAGGGVALARFDGGGTCTWDKLLALPTAAVKAQTFRLGADGSMLAAVVFSGTVNFGGGALTSAGTDALALARFDSSGNLLWDKAFGGAGSSFKLGSVGASAAGEVFLTGGYAGAVDLGGGPLPASADTFLVAFTSAGAFKWSKTVTVGAKGALLAAAGSCGMVVATNSPSVDLGSGPLSTVTSGVASIGVAALGM